MLSKLISISSDKIKNIIFEISNILPRDCTKNLFMDFLNDEYIEIIKAWSENETEMYLLKQLKKYDESASIKNYKEKYEEKYKCNMAIDLIYYSI